MAEILYSLVVAFVLKQFAVAVALTAIEISEVVVHCSAINLPFDWPLAAIIHENVHKLRIRSSN